MSSKKSDSDLYNNSSADFVPVACHHDEHTLLTKNGQLLQTIQINGINSEKISKDLFNLRQIVRKSIRDVVKSSNFAFWIHTVRRKTDLDDPAEYQGLLSANIHDIWRHKNYWDDKFVNRLYITIIHNAPNIKFKRLNSWLTSFSKRAITNLEDKFLTKAYEELNQTVDGILAGVSTYGAKKLGMKVENGNCYSEPIFLYRCIMQLNEEKCPVPMSDISLSLASHQYTVGNDKIEVVGDSEKKFAAIMSIKEYQEVSSGALDKFLQTPIEMIATEVFYFVKQDEVTSSFKEQDYILKISKDEELRKLKGINLIIDEDEEKGAVRFCHQQISFMIIGDNLQMLDSQVNKASETLSRIGIVHVREDINLEKTFWSQLPGNFSFLSKMKPTVLRNTAALASLHNFPTGNQYSPWGRAITLLRTEKGTPYFMNFHDQTNIGTTCIFGEDKSGKTTLLNFLISEADKYKPTVVYLTDDMDSGLYIKAKDGKWIQRDKYVINPLMCEDNIENREFLIEFFKIIAKHYFNPLSDSEIELFKSIVDTVFSNPMEERVLSKIIDNIKESSDTGKSLKSRLKTYQKGGIYHGIFERKDTINLREGEIVAINLQDFDDASYTKNHYPKEKKLLDQFYYNLHSMQSVKAAVALSAQNIMKNSSQGPKIFVIDNLSKIINLEHYQYLIDKFTENMSAINGVFVTTMNINSLQKFYNNEIPQEWISKINTGFILPAEVLPEDMEDFLELETSELKKLADLTSSSRMFLIRQDGKVIASELSISGFPGIVRFLSSDKTEIELYKEVIAKNGDTKPDNWVQEFYERINST